MSVQPIKPSEVSKLKQTLLPDYVLEAFNELIAKEWDDRSAIIDQDDIVTLIKQKRATSLNSEQVEDQLFDNNWLDVEPIYRLAGWKVEYDKPGYNESGRAYYTFTKRR